MKVCPASILETKNLTDGSTVARDLTYRVDAKGKRAVEPQSKGLTGGKQGEQNQGVDLDLSSADRLKLLEDGMLSDLVNTPWAIIQPGVISGSHFNNHESGFANYIITLAMPKKKMSVPVQCPSKVSNEDFLAKIRLAHLAYGVALQKMCVRREKPKGHEHLHCVVSAGLAHFRYRWKRIADYARATHMLYLNFTKCEWASGVLYLTQGSCRKYDFDFIGEPLLYFAPGVQEQTIEEICYGAGHSDTKEKKMEFVEFRALVEKENVRDILHLHRLTVENDRLDRYVNDMKQSANAKLQLALTSITFRNAKPSTLVKQFLLGKTKCACVCKGRTVAALKAWSKGLDFPNTTLNGKKPQPRTGKSWIISLMKACLDGKEFYSMPKGATTYPFERLGWILPMKWAMLLDESSRQRFITWLGLIGWWKLWLDFQTDPHFAPALPSNNKFDRDVKSRRKWRRTRMRILRFVVAAAAVVENPQNVVVAAAAANIAAPVVPVVPAAAAAVNPNLANQEADVAQVIAGVNAVGGQPAQGAGANAVVPGGQPEVGQELLLTHPWRGNVGDWEGKYKTQFLDTQEFDNARTVGSRVVWQTLKQDFFLDNVRGNIGIMASYVCCMMNRFDWTQKQADLLTRVCQRHQIVLEDFQGRVNELVIPEYDGQNNAELSPIR
eukprot:g19435.t1